MKGNHLLQQTVVERSVYPFLGEGKSIDDVDKARQSLETAYRSQGYPTVLVDIPEQDVVNGVVYLNVTEGRVDRLKITGSKFHSLDKIREDVPSVSEGSVPKLSAFQEEMNQLNAQSQDRKITPIMRAGRAPGTVEVELKVRDELPLHGSIELNNQRSASTASLRTLVNLRYDNLWQMFHSASLQFQISPQDANQVQVWAGTYVLPVFDTGMRLALYGVGSNSNTGVASAGALSVIGTGLIFGLRLINPLPGMENFYHSATFGVDYKSFDENIELTGADSIVTPISYLPFSFDYEGSYLGEKARTDFGLGLKFSIRGLQNNQIEFENKRFLAQSNFIYFYGNLDRKDRLPLDFEIQSLFRGQYSPDPLINNEQFLAGGMQSVRGYFLTQILGDSGISASLSLFSPQLGFGALGEYLTDLRALVFFDVARVWVNRPLPGTAPRQDIAGTGMGLRLNLLRDFYSELDWGFALIDNGIVDSGDSMLQFRLWYGF
ncbi:MAG: BamA/TamA family outer membrane protein [Methylococcaceae bacterium]|nr:BamA/TamA family outer membrane protein [Methylococcaceae bacterium]MCI0734450.1 BamA/TamA family outer membrane protein [Methylococcaceae bacterium]